MTPNPSSSSPESSDCDAAVADATFLRRQHLDRLRRHRRIHLVVILASVSAILASLMIGGSIAFFYLRSASSGHHLIVQDRKAISLARKDPVACVKATRPSQGGLLEIPALDLVAPVLQGTSQSVLEDAVGHDPASTWPAKHGTTVFDAHDITWFSGIGSLKIGSEIEYLSACKELVYRVVRYGIVHAGSPVHNTEEGRLVLVTCYPVDALYLTPLRYVVYADLVGEKSVSGSPASSQEIQELDSSRDVEPIVPAPPALAAEGLGLSTNDAPLGTLGYSGDPSLAWRESSAPFLAEKAVLAEYFGLLRSAAQRQSQWWHDLAPDIPVPSAGALWGSQVTRYDHALDTEMNVHGSTLVSATLTAIVDISGPKGQRTEGLTLVETVSHGRLLGTSLSLSTS